MITFRLVCRRGGHYDTVLVYSGANPEQLTHAGSLSLRRDEAVALWRWLDGAAPAEGTDPRPIMVEVAQG